MDAATGGVDSAMVILVRVDDRLLHGQIICSWVPYLKADSLIVCSDEAASDKLLSGDHVGMRLGRPVGSR